MSKKMLINATHPEENRVAIVEDGILTELDIEIAGKEQTKGNIYKAAVVRVEPGLQAAFLDYGGERFGFLQMGEIHPSYFRNGEGGGRRINDVLRRGQELLVQVVKEERGTKGAALTTFLSLPGRFMVLMPDSDTKGVSRKIEEEAQRKKLKEAMASLELPPNFGYIVRTAGIGQKKEELKRDFDYLVRVWEKINEHARQAKSPSLIYRESNLVIRSIRDYFSADMDEVLVDDPRVCQEAKDFFQEVMPEFARLVKLHQEKRPIFSRYQIEEQIDTISKNKVPLPSGGSIVIDATEALVAVDVNSGKMAGETNVEATAFKSNLEAATETARQLRLRDLGGLIVIDFIDMRDRKHIREIEKRLKDALKYDKARVTVGKISQFGLLEMSRQRIKATLAEGSFLSCPHCHGSGKIKSPEAQAIAFLRKVHAAIAKGQIGRVEGEVPLEVATYLLNTKREELLEMERQHQVDIQIKGRPDFIAGQAELAVKKREKEEPTLDLSPLPVALPAPAPRSVSAPADEEVATPEPAQRDDSLAASAAVEEPEPHLSAEDATAEEGGRKKRKRRRRKKKPEEAVQPGEIAMAASVDAKETEPSLPVEEESEQLAEETEAAADGGGEKKKKRRRRRKKKPAAGEPAGITESLLPTPEPAQASADIAGDAAAAEAMTEAPAEEKSDKEGRPRRRRRSRRRPEAAGETASAAAPADQPAPTTSAEEPAGYATPVPAPPPTPPAADAGGEPAAEPAKARPARKPAARKKKTTEAPAEPPAGTEPAETPVEPGPRKRPSRARKPAGDAKTGTALAAEGAKEGSEEKPKRRSPRKKKPEASE